MKTLFLIIAMLIGSYPSIPVPTITPAPKVTVHSLSKKWVLDGYKYLWFSEDPSEKEKNDYLHLNSDMSFTSVSEGQFESGTWSLDGNKKIHLFKKGEEGELALIVQELSKDRLVLKIDDPEDEDADRLEIHFKWGT